MARIFISYRRDDTPGYAGWVAELLRKHFGTADVFMDLDSIDPGMDFVTVIEEAVGSSDALIALIGKNWLTAIDASHRRRLDNPEDYVRLEIVSALNRGLRVIPALVQGATMPGSADLPDGLKPLARRNAIELSDARFGYDMERLIRTLEEVLNIEPSPLPRSTLAKMDAADNLEQANEELRLNQIASTNDVPLPAHAFNGSNATVPIILALSSIFAMHGLLWLAATLTAYGQPISLSAWAQMDRHSILWWFYHGWPQLIAPAGAIDQQWWAAVVFVLDLAISAGCWLLARRLRHNDLLLYRPDRVPASGPTRSLP